MAVGAAGRGNGTWPPRTVGEALTGAEWSFSARTALERAAAMAFDPATRKADGPVPTLGLRHLIGGALRVGLRERGGTLSAGRLVEAIERRVGANAVQAVAAPDDGDADAALPLSDHAQRALDAALRLCRATTGGGERISARHLIAALLAPPDAPTLSAALGRVWQRLLALDPEDLRAELLAALEADSTIANEVEAWRDLLGTLRLGTAAFVADQPVGDDALGRRADARRLAELACLRANEPPLAIGIFGDWGAGKSTFMRLMEEEIAAIEARWRNDPNTPFVTRVVRVRFNAWSFADANLWASLAVEIFSQLRDAIARFDGGRAGKADALLADITGRREQAERRLAAAKQDAEAIRAARDALAGRIRALEGTIERQRDPTARARAVLETRGREIVASLRALGLIGVDEAKAADALAEEVARIRAAGERSFALSRRLLRAFRHRLAWPLFAAVALFAATATLLPRLMPEAAATVAALLSALAPLAWHAQRAASTLQPLLDAVEADAKAEADLRAERERLAAEREALEARLAAREADLRAAEAEIASLDRAAATPAALLRFFLNESDELKAYEREIGLIGRLRRSFERLDDLMRRQADPNAPTDPALPTIERIVLFIDDLDRLRDEQVVRVLEAIALLLQFRLFVVVVAVDARWLARALKAQYREQFDESGAGPGEYLEKIFQVPFWLQRLAPGDGRYAAFAERLVRIPRVVKLAAHATLHFSASASARVLRADGTVDAEPAIDPDELPQPGDETPRETRAAIIRRVELTEAEARVLEALFPIAGSTPRAIKRFVNLYRLARSARDGEDLRRWLGETGKASQFPAFAFALAVENGFDARLRGHWREALSKTHQDDIFANTIVMQDLGLERDGWVPLRTALRRARDFWSDDSLGGALTVGDIAAHLDEARRLSFHPPEFDPTPLPEESRPDSPGA
ncbi:P-loop NTPase fold protein [Elioraea thermophila]|uniref:P-loop NTPase fold protein n=1 Tax=Elioraea thermophila TaxID=2185104 RepID=UPI000DF2FD7E|nr:P-loop NTPase fold protein [Elioraea thermophila]